MNFTPSWRQWARQLKIETYALYLAYQDPRVPWYARFFAVLVVGYAFSPIDLIPDFIPVLGYLDDLILIPLGIVLALKMIPPDILADCRQQAKQAVGTNKPINRIAAGVIITIWILLALAAVLFIIKMVQF
jgi:uncharacterized membrane protein YkvA (DUF1232 family)